MAPRPFDKIVLTVGNAEQKQLCERLVSSVDSCGSSIAVVSDYDSGCRLGSGGATLSIIDEFCDESKKILLINSGGMSKRSINYAVRGKAFAGLCENGSTVTLFEMIIREAQKLAAGMDAGLLVSCSDILVFTDDLKPDFSLNTGFCVRADFETGSRHGVMFKSPGGTLAAYPHKMNVPALKIIADTFGESSVLIDTGLTYLSPEFITSARKMLRDDSFLSKMKGTGTEINLYSDIISLMSESADTAHYLHEEGLSKAHRELRAVLHKHLGSMRMKVCEVPRQSLLHFGTTAESVSNIRRLSTPSENGCCLINSHISSESECAGGSVFENAVLGGRCIAGKNCLVTDITLNDCFIPDNTLVCGIKLRDGSFVSIICPVNEDPKAFSGETELWEKPRFIKGRTFTDSFKKFYNNSPGEKLSMKACVENADFMFYSDNRRYICDLLLSLSSASELYSRKRNEVISRYFSGRRTLERVECRRNSVTLALPVRVNLSGTWSDAMPFCTDNGGEVINMAVTVDGRLPITVTVEKLDSKKIEFCSDGVTLDFLPQEINELEKQNGFSDFDLHRAALITMGFTPETAVTNGFRLTTVVRGIPKGSGLGTSSILLAGCFRALGLMFSREFSDSEIIRMVFVAEQLMKTGGGWQDQIGGIIPGIKRSFSSPGADQEPSFERFIPDEGFRRFVSERMVLVSTGQRHFGRFIVSDIMNRYLNGEASTVEALNDLISLNSRLSAALSERNTDEFIACINRQWELLKRLSPMVSDPVIDGICSSLESSADALCICGAGGGGYILAVLKSGITPEKVKELASADPVLCNVPDAVRRLSLYD